MVNANLDMVAGFSGSSEVSYISAFHSWRLANGTSADRPNLIKIGEDYFEFTRWGDYSSTTLDPLDSLAFWTVQEYSLPVGLPPEAETSRWGTWIANLVASP